MEYPKIKYVEPLDNYKLFIIFDNSEIKIYDFIPLLSNENFALLSDKNLFFQARKDVGGYGVIWNDDIDISEYELWKNSISITTISELCNKLFRFDNF